SRCHQREAIAKPKRDPTMPITVTLEVRDNLTALPRSKGSRPSGERSTIMIATGTRSYKYFPDANHRLSRPHLLSGREAVSAQGTPAAPAGRRRFGTGAAPRQPGKRRAGGAGDSDDFVLRVRQPLSVRQRSVQPNVDARRLHARS